MKKLPIILLIWLCALNSVKAQTSPRGKAAQPAKAAFTKDSLKSYFDYLQKDLGSTIESAILKAKVKQDEIDAKKKLDAKAKEKKPLAEKIKPDTINNPEIFRYLGNNITKAEVKDNYFTVNFYPNKNYKEAINNINLDKKKLEVKEEQLKQKLDNTSNEEKKDRFLSELKNVRGRIKNMNEALTIIESYKSESEITKNDSVPKTTTSNFKVYCSQAIPNKVITIRKGTTFFTPKFSLLTVPFKFRPRQGSTPSYSRADISNVLLYMGWGAKYEKYFYDSNKSTHIYSAGIFAGPSVESIEYKNSDGTEAKSNQAYLTTGFVITYTYNKITLAAIPLGIDLGFSSTARKWNYDGKIWFGLGIGVDSSLLGF